MTEQSGPVQLIDYAQAAEQVGFDFALSSDHYSPWLTSQGHAPYAWTMLGAAAQATSRIELATYVTCPTYRYHPAVVAQKAATVQLISNGRFVLGMGSGEKLNEHVAGQGWPTVDVRQQKFREAIELIQKLFSGELTTFNGEFFHVSEARLWDPPQQPVPIGAAVSGSRSIEEFAPIADHLITTLVQKSLLDQWQAARPQGAGRSRSFIQLPICWAPDKRSAVELAHAQFRWFGLGWAVNSELPTPASFSAATGYVTADNVAASIPCGPDIDQLAAGFQPALDAGFTDLGLVQIGDQYQRQFLDEAAGPLLEKLRSLRPAA